MNRLLAALLSLAWPLVVGTARAKSLDLRVVSYNVYLVPYAAPARAERLEKLPAKLAELRPDVVMLQEVWSDVDSASLEASLRAQGLEHVRQNPSSALFHYGSSGMLIASRFPITQSQHHSFELGRRPHTPYHLDWIGDKGALDVSVETPLGRLRFVNTHMQASYLTGSYEAVRVAQALELAEWLKDDSLPLVLGGDFNAFPDWPSCQLLRDRAKLRLPAGRWRIDQVLLRDGDAVTVESLAMKRLLQEPVALSDGSARRLSDHRAVLMDLRITRRERSQPAGVKVSPSNHELLERASSVVRENLQRTRRQMYGGYLGLLVCLAFGVGSMARLKRAGQERRRRWTLLAVACVLTCVWIVYFLFGYVPARQAGLERALVKLQQQDG